MHLIRLIVTIAVFSAAVCGARAGIVFSTGQSSYTLPPGTSAVVAVSLEFTGSDAAELTSQGGLLSAGFRMVRTGTPPPDAVAPTQLSANTAEFNDPVLTPIFLGPSAAQAGIWEFAGITGSSGVVGESSAADARTILLGSVTFRAGMSLGRTTFALERYDPNLQTTVTFDAPSITLDGSISPSTVTFNVVPEPTMGILPLVAIAMLLRRNRTHLCQPRFATIFLSDPVR